MALKIAIIGNNAFLLGAVQQQLYISRKQGILNILLKASFVEVLFSNFFLSMGGG